MMPRIFITGATGYIGGDILDNLYTAHPDYSYHLLVRNPDKADKVQKAYPNTHIVYGDLEDPKIIEEQSEKADVVIHTADASDHVGAAEAIGKGLLQGHSASNPGYWLHTGGTGILTFTDSQREIYGEKSSKEYDDWDNVQELINLPDEAFHRNVDKVVLGYAARGNEGVRTALICPPTIYGHGRGPCSQRGRQVYELASATLSSEKGPIIGKGLARWNNVHVADLSDVYTLLVDAAVGSGKTSHSEVGDIWGPNAYYLTENGEHYWGELAKVVAQVAAEKGYIPSPAQTTSLNFEQAMVLAGFEAVSWGMNSRGKALRARKLLGWKPHRKSVEQEVPRILESEMERQRSG